MLILLVNSVGGRRTFGCVYVDEVKNSNMSGNLDKTAAKVHGDGAIFFRMHSIERRRHFKTGVLWTLGEIIRAAFSAILPILSFAAKPGEANLPLMRMLVSSMIRYVNRLTPRMLCVLMTDHHFFSTVVAETHANSVVLQHGLVQDIRFFSPVRASAICCWSAKSAVIIDPVKGVDTGTLKFEVKKDNSRLPLATAEVTRALVCLSRSKTAEQIRACMEPIIRLKERYGFTVLIKTHPGSFFSLTELNEYLGASGIELYKEEKIEDLNFDFAFVEQSTAVLDIASLGVPFIVCDEDPESYFAEYAEVLPTAKGPDEVERLFDSFDFEAGIGKAEFLLEREIDGGRNNLSAYLLNRCKDNS